MSSDLGSARELSTFLESLIAPGAEPDRGFISIVDFMGTFKDPLAAYGYTLADNPKVDQVRQDLLNGIQEVARDLTQLLSAPDKTDANASKLRDFCCELSKQFSSLQYPTWAPRYLAA